MHSEARPIDHSAAHRSTQSELLVTELRARDERHWEVGLSIPRGHWLCHPTPTTVPLTLVAEVLRQAGIAVCIEGLGIDRDVHFIISSLEVHVSPPGPAFPRFGAFEDAALVSFADIRHRKGVPTFFEVDYAIGPTIRAHISARALSPRDYAAVRRNAVLLDETIVDRSETLLLDPQRVGSHASATLGVNEADPFFFDHPVDHLPGMLLLHSALALHEWAADAPVADAAVSFPRFAELRTPTRLEAQIGDGSQCDITILQGETTVAVVSASSGAATGGVRP